MSEFFADDIIEILLDIREQGMSAFREVRDQMAEISAASLAAAAATKVLDSAQESAARSASDEAGELREVKRAAVEATGATAAMAAVAGTLRFLPGESFWAYLVVGILAVMAVLAPLSALFLSATVVLISFTVAATGFLAIAALVGLAFGGIAAGVLLLSSEGAVGAADNLAKASKALADAKQNLANFHEAHTGAGSPGTGPTAAQDNRVTDLERRIEQLKERVAASKSHTPTLSQHQQLINLEIELERAKAADVGKPGSAGGLSISQKQQEAKLIERLAEAQKAYNVALEASQGPIAVLIQQIKDMADHWERAAVPMAKIITLWAGTAIPTIQAFGDQIMQWFGVRLPGVLRGIGRVIADILPDVTALGVHFGKIMDHMGPIMEDFAKMILHWGIDAIRGLLDNFVRLSDWLVKQWPTMGPILAQTFNKLGEMIQWVGEHWQDLNDFVERKWPATVKNAEELLKEIQAFWDKNGKTITDFVQNLITLMGYMNQAMALWGAVAEFMKHTPWSPDEIFKVLDAVNKVIDAIGSVINWFSHAGDAMVNWSLVSIIAIRDVIAALNKIPHFGLPDIPMPNLPGSGGSSAGSTRRGGHQTLGEGGTVRGPYPGAPMIIEAHVGEHVSTDDAVRETNSLLRAILEALSVPSTGRTGVEASLYKAVQGAGINRLRGMPGY